MAPTMALPVVSSTTGNNYEQTAANVSSAYTQKYTRKPINRQVRTLETPLYVPAELEKAPFVCWRYDVDKNSGKLTKVPINPRTGGKAKIDTRSTWSDFETAYAYYCDHPDQVSGLFVVMRDTPLAGADFDHCIVDGVIQPAALSAVRSLNSYTEVSPSGTGLRVFALGVKPGPRSKQGDIELYDGSSKRFLSFTGHHLPGTPLELRDVTPEFTTLYHETFPEPAVAPVVRRDPQPVDVDDQDLLAAAMRAKNGASFVDLWHGRTTAYASRSEADYALVGKLLFWTAGDVDRVDRLFRQSDLWREKWDRKTGDSTYGMLTIIKCAAGQTKYYTPPAPRPANVTTAGEVVQPPTIADLWRTLNAHIHHDGDRCPMCGRLWTEEWEVGDKTYGRWRLFRCKRADCLDWQTHRAKQLVAQSEIHLWPAHYLTMIPVEDYDRFIDRGLLSREDHWRGVAETNETMFVASGFAIDGRSIATRWDALAPMLAERWLSRKPGSRLRDPKKMARSKRAAVVACDAEQPAAVVTSVPPEPKPTRRAAFGLVDMEYSEAHDFLAVLETAGATVDHKRGRWSYLTAKRDNIATVVTAWADVTGLGGRREIDTFRPGNSQNAYISPSVAVVDVLAGDLHPEAAAIARNMTARTVKNHGRRSG